MKRRFPPAIPYCPIPASGIDYSSNVTKNLAFWKYLNGAVKAKHPNAFFVGENFDGHAYHVAPYYQGFDSLVRLLFVLQPHLGRGLRS
jgi:hypothetical protein